MQIPKSLTLKRISGYAPVWSSVQC